MYELSYLAEAAVISGLAVCIVQQILKLKIVPVSFANKYPVPTNIALSTVAAIVAVLGQGGVDYTSPVQLIAVAGLTSLVASMTYNNLFANWAQLKAAEEKIEK